MGSAQNPCRLRRELEVIGIRPLSIEVADYGHSWAVRTRSGTAAVEAALLWNHIDLENWFYCGVCHIEVPQGTLRSAMYSVWAPWRQRFIAVALCERCARMPKPELERGLRETVRLRDHWDRWADRVEAEMREHHG